jgi:protease I
MAGPAGGAAGAGLDRARAGAQTPRVARVAFLLAAGFEDSELRVPVERLRGAGHDVVIVGLEAGRRLAGKRGVEAVTTDAAIADASPDAFDAVVIPGGRSPERLRADPRILAFVRAFAETGRPIAAVCHGPLLLAAAGVARGRTLTSWPAIREELAEAGARWADREVVEDGGLVTSRRPADLEPFCRALLGKLGARGSR